MNPPSFPLQAAAIEAEHVALYGGSFDPVHDGHLHVARVAQAARGLDHVVFVPAARPPHKPGRQLASPAARLAMLELALEGGAPSWSIWDVELRRAGPSFTIDTVREFIDARAVAWEQRGGPKGGAAPRKPYFVLGSDNLPGLPAWRDLEQLLECVTPLIVYRSRFGPETIDELDLPEPLREQLREGFIIAPPHAASSTELRDALAREVGADRSPHPEVPPNVARYIHAQGLYGGDLDSR